MTNLPDAETATAMAHYLVEQRLAACVNILPQVRSIYQWQGAVEEAAEVTLMIKARQEHYAGIEAAIQEAHPYQVPEIIALPITAGLPLYLDWIVQEKKKDVDV